MRTHSSKYLFSMVAVVCLACRYVHIQLYIYNTSYAQFFLDQQTTKHWVTKESTNGGLYVILCTDHAMTSSVHLFCSVHIFRHNFFY
jgi:hypothetical protein